MYDFMIMRKYAFVYVRMYACMTIYIYTIAGCIYTCADFVEERFSRDSWGELV